MTHTGDRRSYQREMTHRGSWYIADLQKDVNENTNVMQAAAAIDGASKGAHKYLNLPILSDPAGSNLICSSSLGSSVDITGSQKRITNAILNHA